MFHIGLWQYKSDNSHPKLAYAKRRITGSPVKPNRASRAALCWFSPFTSPTSDPFCALLYPALTWAWLLALIVSSQCKKQHKIWKLEVGKGQSIYFPPAHPHFPSALIVWQWLHFSSNSCQALVTLFPPLASSELRVPRPTVASPWVLHYVFYVPLILPDASVNSSDVNLTSLSPFEYSISPHGGARWLLVSWVSHPHTIKIQGSKKRPPLLL